MVKSIFDDGGSEPVSPFADDEIEAAVERPFWETAVEGKKGADAKIEELFKICQDLNDEKLKAQADLLVERGRHGQFIEGLTKVSDKLKNDLSDQKAAHVAETRELVANHEKAINQVQGRFAQLEHELSEALKAGNLARDQAYSATMDAERLRGYLDALNDANPPKMVPEEKTLRREAFGYTNAGPWNKPPGYKPWYHR